MTMHVRERRAVSARLGVTAAVLCAMSVVPAATHAQSAAKGPSVGKTVKVGSGVYEVVVSPSTGTVYVATAGARDQPGASVVALNGETLDVVKTYDMTAAPPYGIGINDRTQTVYTTNSRNNSVSALDVKSGQIRTVASEADKSAHLREVVTDAEANVTYASSYAPQGVVWVIDGRTNEIALIQNVGNGTSGLVVDRAANRLWATNMSGNEVAGIDLETRQVVERFPAGGERPTNIAVDPRSGRLFVANQGGTMTVLDPKAGGKLLANVATGAGALDVEFNPATNLAYVANRGAGTVTVINGTSYEVVSTLRVGAAPNTLTIDPKSGFVYVTTKAPPAGRGRGRGQDAGAPAAPPPPADPAADSVTVIRP